MSPKGILKLFVICGIMGIFIVQNSLARISSLSPWGLQDRLPTKQGQLDQTVGPQFGINGVSPAGTATDSTFFTFPYSLNYGLLEKLEVGAGLGLQWLDRKNSNSQLGISDLVVAGRYRFFDPNRAEKMPGLDIETGFSFPTASFEKGLGTGGLGILFGWGLILPLDPVRAHFGMGFRLNTENSDEIQVGNIFSYNGGFTYPLKQFKEELSLTGELKGFNHARNKRSGNKEGSTPDELYLSPGAIWNFSQKFKLSGALLIGLTSESSDLGMNLELRF